ncbi:MAG TPA: RHS repeat-associated core domain-containing protein, partial [Candidatus Paceibacterota bacterium]
GNTSSSFIQNSGQWLTVIAVFKPTTSVSTTTYNYDKNGNLASTTANLAHTWDYRNQLTQTINQVSTSTYGYDTSGQRVLLTVATTTSSSKTSYYPSKLYNVSLGIATKHIFVGDQLLATVQGTSTAATPTYTHLDHLGSTNVTTTASSTIAELSDYYPYGAGRMEQRGVGKLAEQRKYIGQEYDPNTQLNYLNARYQNPTNGNFISQDPVFWEDPKKQNLVNPQSLNSYAYANGNPIVSKDPDGRAVIDLSFGGGGILIGGYAGVKVDTKGSYQTYFGTTYGPSVGLNFNLNASSGYLNPTQERQDYVTRDFSVVPLIGFNRSKTAIQNPSDPFDFSNDPQVSYNLSLGLTLGLTQGFKTEGKVQSNQQQPSSNSSSLNKSISFPRVSGSSGTTFQSLGNSLVQLQAALMSYSASISATSPTPKKNN